MFTGREKKLLKWLLPSWILILIIGVFVWYFYFQKNDLEKTNSSKQEKLSEELFDEAQSKEKKPEPILLDYIEIIDGCSPEIDDSCVIAHSSPTSTSPIVSKLRKGMVLRVSEIIKNEETNNETWYKITFDEWLRYPERVANNWYVSEKNTRHFKHIGSEELNKEDTVEGGERIKTATSTKYIIIDRSDQTLKAFNNKEDLFIELPISSGLSITPTPRGTFTIFRKTPSRYMQGPLPGISDQYYDLAGVPWNLYFTEQGAVIHGAYWHDQFGKQWSHGCVNLEPSVAKNIYEWAELGTQVFVID